MEKKRKRGLLINFLLILYVLAAVLNIFSFVTNDLVKVTNPQFVLTQEQVMFTTAMGVLSIIVIAGVFIWNKIAIYLFVLIGIGNAVNGFIKEGVTATSIVGAVLSIGIPVLISYVLLKRMKEYNEEINN